MRTERKNSKGSWPKKVVKKWLNIKSSGDEFRSDYTINGKVDKVERRRKSSSETGCHVVVPEELAVADGCLTESRDPPEHPRFEPEESSVPSNLDLRMFVGTWNVGGKSPHRGLNLRDWLTTPSPADIYVLGFQEIVPLNAGNILGAQDNGPAANWLSLIRQALNDNAYDTFGLDADCASATDAQLQHSPLPQSHAQEHCQQIPMKPRISFSDLLSLEDGSPGQEGLETYFSMQMNSSFSTEEASPTPSPRSTGFSTREPSPRRSNYCLAASKQMVGIFLCVWVRSDLRRHISSLKVSCVSRGIMGYLGNKGSISISMILQQTSLCFVCTHLASGEKEGDEIKRNSDVIEILRKTRFSHSRRSRLPGKPVPPDCILDHEKIIWLGDLNYRLAPGSSYHAIELLKRNAWEQLLEKDQLRIEQRAGRVFKDWEEGRIYFAPTYKYLNNSDDYLAQISTSKHKSRTPAWCDRILWKGEGLKQMWYVRGESKFSDHRPVYSLFSAKVNVAQNMNAVSINPDATEPSMEAALQPTVLPSARAGEVLAEERQSDHSYVLNHSLISNRRIR